MGPPAPMTGSDRKRAAPAGTSGSAARPFRTFPGVGRSELDERSAVARHRRPERPLHGLQDEPVLERPRSTHPPDQVGPVRAALDELHRDDEPGDAPERGPDALRHVLGRHPVEDLLDGHVLAVDAVVRFVFDAMRIDTESSQ